MLYAELGMKFKVGTEKHPQLSVFGKMILSRLTGLSEPQRLQQRKGGAQALFLCHNRYVIHWKINLHPNWEMDGNGTFVAKILRQLVGG